MTSINRSQNMSCLDAHLADSHKKRDEFIKRFNPKYTNPGLLGIVIVLILIWAGAKRFSKDDYWMNLLTEGIGITITVLIIDRLNEYRDEQRYKQDLIRKAGSVANDIAIDAVENLRREKWLVGESGLLVGSTLKDANLKNAPLIEANLQNANLSNSNLQYAKLSGANLQHATLWSADLQNAELNGADLRHTKLVDANLQHANLAANLQHANLSGADLQHAKMLVASLQHANLSGADLQHAKLFGAKMQHALLIGANLQHARLPGARMQHTTLMGARFNYAEMIRTNLQSADLTDSILEHCDLRYACLQEANLKNTNLQHANLNMASLRDVENIEFAHFNERTILPDGLYWNPTTQIKRYTDPNHKSKEGVHDFWEPPYLSSNDEGSKPMWVSEINTV